MSLYPTDRYWSPTVVVSYICSKARSLDERAVRRLLQIAVREGRLHLFDVNLKRIGVERIHDFDFSCNRIEVYLQWVEEVPFPRMPSPGKEQRTERIQRGEYANPKVLFDSREIKKLVASAEAAGELGEEGHKPKAKRGPRVKDAYRFLLIEMKYLVLMGELKITRESLLDCANKILNGRYFADAEDPIDKKAYEKKVDEWRGNGEFEDLFGAGLRSLVDEDSSDRA